ncbi:MAG: UDP-N-acetylmuramoyl-L-alanine--D-glutamate ligase [Bdellovibrionota bacterium]
MLKLKGKKVTVVGLGKSGVSAARFLTNQGAKVTISDSKPKSELIDSIKTLGELKVELDLGKHTSKVFTSADLIVLSPGVPSNIEPLVEAKNAGVPITNDIEIATSFIKSPIIAVTGTNGKTTTTALIGDMLKNDGKKVFVGGNIGIPVLDLFLEETQPDVVVLEVSSFQLETVETFKPAVCVFTNLEPDHLDRYPNGVETYYEAKRRMLRNADKNTVLVTNIDNELTARLAETFPGKVLRFTKRNPMTISGLLAEQFQGAYLQRPKMVLKMGKEEVVDLLTCKLPGDHNRENIMAAATAAVAMGCSRAAIQKTVECFKGVSHRLEYIRRKDGVSIYNDSKATNVGSVIRSLNSFNAPIILIAGGRDKDQDFGPLTDLVKKKVKNLILVGEAKEKINRIIGDFSETFLVGTFEEAVLLAYQKSRNGDIVLLSPACASFDMFKSFEERGDYFKKLVSQL